MSGFKKDDDERVNPFANLVKSTVLQEARLFHKSPIKAGKCIPILTKILYLLHQGESLTTTEATDVFFATSKLFQATSLQLRRMVYLVIKELAESAEDVIMITAVVMKDLNSNSPMLKANSVRVLCNVTDPSMLGQIERYIMQAIVDKNTYVASAALVSAMHLMGENKDIVKRWVSQVNEALKSRAVMVQYHALGLLYKIKQQDRLAVTRLVQTLTKQSTLRCPYATCLLIRLASHVIADDPSGVPDTSLFDYLELCLRHKSEMVIYEAARAICNIPSITARELTPAITVLHLLLGSPKSSHKYAAVRTLNAVAMTHPVSVTQCMVELETLVKDSNRSVATLAITTLLKIGSESSVERLMTQMSEFMGDIPDEFKVVVVDAIRSLCLRYPKKHHMMISFLAAALRDSEGGYEYKKTIVDTIMLLIDQIPDAAESGLSQLCEFIEDCDFPILSIRILHLMGAVGPRTANPSRFIRFIYNRVILEVAPVRAAAVSTLARFGLLCEPLKDAVTTLLKRCMFDTDDEVRDRCAMYVALLEAGASPEDVALVLDDGPLPVKNLEAALLEYQAKPSRTPFNLATVQPDPVAPAARGAAAAGEAPHAEASPAAAAGSPAASSSAAMYAAMIAAVPQLAPLGAPYASSAPVQLTEIETEYQVNVVKHSFAQAVLLQFNVTNTLDMFCLKDVTPVVEFADGDDGLEPIGVVAAPTIAYGAPGTAWVVLRKEATAFPSATFSCTLKFRVLDVDPESGEPEEGDEGEDDEYEVDEVDIAPADYMQKTFVPNFAAAWDKFTDDHQSLELFALGSLGSVAEAVSTLIDLLGMQVCERSNAVKPDAVTHTLLLSAVFAGQVPLLVRIRLKLDQTRTVQMELTVRCEVEFVRELVLSLVG
ncbi:coatomer subunit gamma-1 [Thecamonas trahens ATCC 50062]|uniref:Coatomer subunit gamma n=1 Tax=Thecamonas trahens ATCC 50062 TaxID=461836 RepID=A0A0L0DNE1_THETB|nr:coatomer subunit gamma-1 [Thecamonas trahens ATCC 50062]KNC53775.1 coatomer subunit gamma-1 [Thecamonas trahens ATCC 50062]|eukprot:XP_013754337.1 coatomer subunit gamma-1 [Thecamonas trahens ATCC 50062]